MADGPLNAGLFRTGGDADGDEKGIRVSGRGAEVEDRIALGKLRPSERGQGFVRLHLHRTDRVTASLSVTHPQFEVLPEKAWSCASV